MKTVSLKLKILSVLLATSICGQAIASPTALWEKTFGGPNEDNSRSVSQTNDGGYILTGGTRSYGAGSVDVYLVKADSDGNEVWSKTFGGTGYDHGWSVQQTSEGGYVIAAEGVANLIKTDPNGNEQWSKTFPSFSGAYSVEQTEDGGYIVAGWTGADIYLVKTDPNGNQQWDGTFGGSDKEHGYWVRQTSDGGYIITGDTRSSGAGGFDVYLIKTDSDGNSVWEKTFGGSLNDAGYCVQQTTDGGYIVTGITNYQTGSDDVYLIKTDPNGIKEWEKTFGGSSIDHGMEVQQTSDGGYIIAAYTNSFGAGSYDAYLIKTDSAGNLEWRETFGGELMDSVTSVQQTSDGEYIAAGLTASYGAGSTDAYLLYLSEPPCGFSEDFDNYATGSTPCPPWQCSIQPGVTIEIDDNFYISGKSLHFIDPSSSAQGVITHSFEQSSFVVLEYYMRSDNENYEGAFVMLRGDGGTDYCVNFGNAGGGGHAGYIGVVGALGGWIEPDLMPYTPNTWYYVRRTLDCNTNTGYFYVEEVGNPNNNASYNVGSNYVNTYINEIFTWTSGSQGADCYIDEITIACEPKDPVELLMDLTTNVIGLNLQQGISNSLDAKLSAAMQALEDINTNNDVAAINTLQAFINAVEAQRGNKITEADADELIAAAQEIIDLLSAE